MQLNSLPVRQPAPEPPEGGISIRAAAKKYKKQYHVTSPTISRWVARNLIPVLLRTNKEVYISEAKFIEVAEKYNRNPGRGKRTALDN